MLPLIFGPDHELTPSWRHQGSVLSLWCWGETRIVPYHLLPPASLLLFLKYGISFPSFCQHVVTAQDKPDHYAFLLEIVLLFETILQAHCSFWFLLLWNHYSEWVLFQTRGIFTGNFLIEQAGLILSESLLVWTPSLPSQRRRTFGGNFSGPQLSSASAVTGPSFWGAWQHPSGPCSLFFVSTESLDAGEDPHSHQVSYFH